MNLINRLLSFVDEQHCIACSVTGVNICETCLSFIVTDLPSSCYRCNALTISFATCSHCKRSSRLTAVYVAGEYDGFLKQLIHDYKFKSERHLVQPFVQLLKNELPVSLAQKPVLFVPIATATSRVRERGFDHTKLLASELAFQLRQLILPCLVRTDQSRQVGSTRQQRKFQLEKKVRATYKHKIIGRDICLVDDVMSTGATLEAAADALKKAGARSVVGVVLGKA